MLTKESLPKFLLEGADDQGTGGGLTGGNAELIEIETVEGPQKVTLDQLKKGFMLESDYRKKTAELGERARQEARRLADEEVADLTAEYEAKVAELEAKVNESASTQEELIYEDPQVKKLSQQITALQQRIEGMQKSEKEKQEQQEFETWFGKQTQALKEQYPYMHEPEVAAIAWMQRGFNKSERERIIEEAAKASHERVLSLHAELTKKDVEAAKLKAKEEAEKKVSQLPSGGGLPAGTVKIPKTFEEARKSAEQRLELAREEGG